MPTTANLKPRQIVSDTVKIYVRKHFGVYSTSSIILSDSPTQGKSIKENVFPKTKQLSFGYQKDNVN